MKRNKENVPSLPSIGKSEIDSSENKRPLVSFEDRRFLLEFPEAKLPVRILPLSNGFSYENWGVRP